MPANLNEPAIHIDTICAIATAPGKGGVGIVRVSGPHAHKIGLACTKQDLKARYAHFVTFHSEHNELDQGIALYFPAPNSFTGEEVFEFQGHGGPVIDLIDANSKQAALRAVNSLKGLFADEVNLLLDQLTHLRLYVESAIDFPEEEIDFLGDGIVQEKLERLLLKMEDVNRRAKQGAAIREGMKVALAGKPNAGKSTLLNALAEREIAIVTDIEGTTRDAITEHIHIDGMPLHITDTAGIRKTDSKVEQIGIERAWSAIHDADKILLLIDSREYEAETIASDWPELFNNQELKDKLTLVINKLDLDKRELNTQAESPHVIRISAKQGLGIDELRDHLTATMGLSNLNEGSFSARRRHLDALDRCQHFLLQGQVQLETAAGELLAEDLRQAQEALGEITGKFSADDLLGLVFSSFCIGK